MLCELDPIGEVKVALVSSMMNRWDLLISPLVSLKLFLAHLVPLVPLPVNTNPADGDEAFEK